MVLLVLQRVKQRLKDCLIPKVARVDGIEYLLHLSRKVFVTTCACHLMLEVIDFVDSSSKDEDVFLTNFLSDLNVSPIKSANNKSPIHYKLHIRSAACLSACSRDMLTDLRGRNDDFSIRDIVVRQKHDF